MICSRCEGGIPDESVFCLYCGKKQLETPRRRAPKTRKNGAGTAYLRGKTWTAKVTCGKKTDAVTGAQVPDTRTKGGFGSKAEALGYIPLLSAQGGARERTRPETTLAALWKHYSENAMRKISANKQSHYRTAYKRIGKLVHRPVRSLTINDLQDAVNENAATHYPARDIKTLLTRLYDRAVAQDDVRANLAKYIDLPELGKTPRRPFNEDELKRLWRDYGCGHQMSGYILLMTYSGMMPGELRRCEKSMIDWERQQITGCGLKTAKRKETPIVIAGAVMPVLQELCRQSDSKRLYPFNWHDRFYKDFHETLRRCGVADRAPYCCRHTTATVLALGNIAPGLIKEIMRHARFSTTESYIHREFDSAPMLEALNSVINKT